MKAVPLRLLPNLQAAPPKRVSLFSTAADYCFYYTEE